MTNYRPTEHLSPTQLQAYLSLESDKSVEVRSASFSSIVEILNLLITEDAVTIACNTHTLRLAQDYKLRHSTPADEADLERLSLDYHKAIEALKEAYTNSYPLEEAALIHQYKAVLNSFGLSVGDDIDMDERLAKVPSKIYQSITDLEAVVASYKRTWSKYEDIDPFHEAYYHATNVESLSQYLGMWISNVRAIYNDMRKGLKEIVDAEMYRLLSVKKQLTQHLVNYQHNQSENDLKEMRQKMGFMMADLPKDSYRKFTDLVMFAVSNWDSAISKYLNRYRKRFNSRNSQSVLIYEASQELKVVLRDIENNGNIKLDMPSNPLSYETQINQVKELLDHLEYCESWIKDESDYISWKKFYTQLASADKSFVDVLTSLDKSVLQKQLNYIEIQSWKDGVVSKGIPTAKISLDVFEAFKELNASINWSNVRLISESINTDYTLTFDGVYYILSNVASSDTNTTITIKDKNLLSIKPMVTLDYYGQSEQAKHLTAAMEATGAQFKTYQTRSLNIISCLDDVDSIELLSLLAGNNINELKGESIADLIKGSILEEGKEKLLIVYDDLLNVRQVENYIWQRLVLQSMSSAGYKVISINTHDRLKHVGLQKHLASYMKSSTSELFV